MQVNFRLHRDLQPTREKGFVEKLNGKPTVLKLKLKMELEL